MPRASNFSFPPNRYFQAPELAALRLHQKKQALAVEHLIAGFASGLALETALSVSLFVG